MATTEHGYEKEGGIMQTNVKRDMRILGRNTERFPRIDRL
jgi:hypothetical protein